jgi:hypothetical protein
MWYPIRDYTLADAKQFLLDDFIKVLKRTKYHYVERKPRKSIGYGFFEPILLCLCWCDFLGALYCGDGKSIREGGLGNTKRSEIFINDVLGAINPDYRQVSADLIKIYRHGTVHAYAPAGNFDIRVSDKVNHLKLQRGRVILSLEDLLTDMIKGVKLFAQTLHLDSQSLSRGSLVAFNKARTELG